MDNVKGSPMKRVTVLTTLILILMLTANTWAEDSPEVRLLKAKVNLLEAKIEAQNAQILRLKKQLAGPTTKPAIQPATTQPTRPVIPNAQTKSQGVDAIDAVRKCRAKIAEAEKAETTLAKSKGAEDALRELTKALHNKPIYFDRTLLNVRNIKGGLYELLFSGMGKELSLTVAMTEKQASQLAAQDTARFTGKGHILHWPSSLTSRKDYLALQGALEGKVRLPSIEHPRCKTQKGWSYTAYFSLYACRIHIKGMVLKPIIRPIIRQKR